MVKLPDAINHDSSDARTKMPIGKKISEVCLNMKKWGIMVLVILNLLLIGIVAKLFFERGSDENRIRELVHEVLKQREDGFVKKYRPAMRQAMSDLGVESGSPESVDEMLEMYLNIVLGVHADETSSTTRTLTK